jgi:ribonuclease D
MSNPQNLPPPIWVDRSAGFRAMLAHLNGQPAIAVDTESNSLFAYKERVCLIQISVPGADYLLDPINYRDIAGLGPLLADPGILKVFHGGEYDLALLDRDFGFRVQNLFDTMWASRILGWRAHGLAALLQEHFGVHLNKKYQRANWGLRPLPPEQLNYARLDSHYLLALHQIQAQQLEARNRWPQARHRFNKLVQARHEPRKFNPEGFWRLSGVRDLDDVGRGVLRELFLYRDQRARSENRPPFKVLGNQVMLTLSEQRPRHYRELPPIKGISKRMADRYGRGILAAIRRGEQQPLAWSDRPRPGPGSSHPPNGRASHACQARFEALRAWRNTTAEKRGVEPDIVLTNQTLWEVAHRNPRRTADLARDGLLARWQVDEFGQELLSVVQSTR